MAKRIRRDYYYGHEKFYSAVRSLVGYGERRDRLAHAVGVLVCNIHINRNPQYHLPKEIREEYLAFKKWMTSVEATRNEGNIMATINSLDETELTEAERKIISFYDTVCRYQKPL